MVVKFRFFILILIFLWGCGKKGELYHSEDNMKKRKPANIEKDRVYKF